MTKALGNKNKTKVSTLSAALINRDAIPPVSSIFKRLGQESSSDNYQESAEKKHPYGRQRGRVCTRVPGNGDGETLGGRCTDIIVYVDRKREGSRLRRRARNDAAGREAKPRR